MMTSDFRIGILVRYFSHLHSLTFVRDVGRETAQNKYVQTNNVDAEENFAPLG